MRDGEAGTRAGVIVVIAAAVIAIAGVTLLVVGLLGAQSASDTRDRATRVRREAATAAARTHELELGSSSPITKAETVASSVADIVDAGDTVVDKSQSTAEVLSRAVDLANTGRVDAARSVYRGEGATAVQDLQAQLAKARAAQAAAQHAVDDLLGTRP